MKKKTLIKFYHLWLIQFSGHGPAGSMLELISLKKSIQYWMDNFEEMTFTEGEGLPGTDVGFWGGNTYPVSQAMSGPNNVRMYGTWSMTNSTNWKNSKFKALCCTKFQ